MTESLFSKTPVERACRAWLGNNNPISPELEKHMRIALTAALDRREIADVLAPWTSMGQTDGERAAEAIKSWLLA